jgi:hypothetical protein
MSEKVWCAVDERECGRDCKGSEKCPARYDREKWERDNSKGRRKE